jgi:magnesium transporter
MSVPSSDRSVLVALRTRAPNDAALLRGLRTRVPIDAAALLAHETPERVAQILKELHRPYAVRIAAHLPEALRPAELAAAAEDAPPGLVADIMESTPGVLPATMTVKDTVEWLRKSEAAHELTYLYVTGPDNRLLGLIVMRDLMLAEPDETLADVMIANPFVLRNDQSIKEAIKGAVVRHFPAYPVCDAEGRFQGLVRGWRLFEQQAIEISAQSGQMVGVNKGERVSTPMFDSFRMRHPWLQLNLLTAFAAAFVVGSFADTIEKIVALAAFLPVLAGQSGNTGLQALTITLRGLILGDIDEVPRRKLLFKEIALGLLNGVLTGLVAGVAMYFSTVGDSGSSQALLLALVIVLAMTGACLMSGISGVLIPLGLKRLGADPATASSIFLTTITDVAGMGLMLFLATVLIL